MTSAVPDPRDVFQDPAGHWTFLTLIDDNKFEGQHFDRKEVCRPSRHGTVSDAELSRFRREHIAESISAFANVNPAGGLLVLGVGSGGEVRGLSHLRESQRNALAVIDDLLVNQASEVKFFDCKNCEGVADTIALVYVPYTTSGICETVGRSPRAWKRQGAQNLPLSDADRDRLKRDKGLVDFERTVCAAYDVRDVDQGVLKEFRQSYLADSTYERSDEDLLYQIGALARTGEGYSFTNAGALFFAANPQRMMAATYVRLLRFDVPIASRDNRPLPTAEKVFTGPLTKQIRDFRNFLKESAFFKTYQRRNADGGFTDEPEFPFNAVDEAVVNAVAHRDYAVKLPILCEKYTDALLVRSPGAIIQPHEVPATFTLADTQLEHLPRNATLMEWLKTIKDARGTSFVRALQEGTRQMREAMGELGLPAPGYSVTDADTTVMLYNNVVEREAALLGAAHVDTTHFTNLYPLMFDGERALQNPRADRDRRRHEFLSALKDKLTATGWYVDSIKFGVLTAHRRGNAITLPDDVAAVVNLYPAYSFQLREYWGQAYLVVDYGLTVQSVQTVGELSQQLVLADLVGLSAAARWTRWERGRISAANSETCRVFLYDYAREEQIASARVIPRLPRRLIDAVLAKNAVNFDLAREIKRASLALEPNAARVRTERTQATVNALTTDVFPLAVGGQVVRLGNTPLPLAQDGDGASALRLETIKEPEVEFSGHRSSADIRDGITRWGSYDTTARDVELIPVCTPDLRQPMAALIERLQTGKFKYRGAERTFHTRLTYRTIVTAPEASVVDECRRLLGEHPEWQGDSNYPRLFLVHSPEARYALDDERSPYYLVKRVLFEGGVPCQMVDTPTLLNPDYKDLNLALNVVAKTGVTPWVLPDSIPDADFFVGLSYTENRRTEGLRFMGFANVFNQYGRWEFYSGSTEAFSYEERAQHYGRLIEQTLSRLTLPEAPSIYFHYSAKFSREDREAILAAARRVRAKGKYAFLWFNMHHSVRLYDRRAETDGSLARGSYVVASHNQFYLSTTGFNPYRKVLGTPHALEVNAHVQYPQGATRQSPDLRALASQVLSLTKLNWASTDSLCAEPITTKYAGDIAYLTAAFQRQSGAFRLHPALERTPWFI